MSLLDLELDQELDLELLDYGEMLQAHLYYLQQTPAWDPSTYLQMQQEQTRSEEKLTTPEWRISDITKPEWKRPEGWEKEQKDRRRYEQRMRKLVKLLIKALLYLQWYKQVLLSALNDISVTPPLWKKRLKSISICMPWCIPPALIILWGVVWMFRPGTEDPNEWYHAHNETVDPAALTTIQSDSASVDWLVGRYLPDYRAPYPHASISGGAVGIFNVPESSGLGEAPGDLFNPYDFNLDFLASSVPPFDLSTLVPDPVPWTDSFPLPNAVNLLASEAPGLPRTASTNANVLHALVEKPMTTAPRTSLAGPTLFPSPRANAHTAQPDGPPHPNGQVKKQPRTKTQVCTRCHLSFISRRDLRRHTTAIHDKAKPFVCNEPGCDHRTSREDNVLRHKRLVHGLGKDGTTLSTPTVSASPAGSAPHSTSSRGKRLSEEGATDVLLGSSSSSKQLTPGETEQRLREMEIQLHSEREKRRQLEDQLRARDLVTRAGS